MLHVLTTWASAAAAAQFDSEDQFTQLNYCKAILNKSYTNK
jgi:hypothetical protein